MHASFVVLAALVAVAAGQYWGMPLDPVMGVPFDTPEVVHAKHFHAIAHANAAVRSGMLFRKRRDVSTTETMSHEEQSPEANDAKEKRQILYSGYGYPYSSIYSYPYARMGWWRKKRDTSEVNAAEATPEESKEKRQVLIGGSYYPTFYSSGIYGYPGWWRKKRDTSEVSATEATPEESKEKRQILYSGYGYPYSSIYTYPYARMGWWRKKRDTNEVNAAEATSEESKEKRQLLLGYGYPTLYSGMYGAYPYRRWL